MPKVGRSSLPEYLLRYEITLKKKELFKLFRREITAGELWDKRVFWTLVAEWFGYYEDMEKLPNDCLDVDFNILRAPRTLIMVHLYSKRGTKLELLCEKRSI